MRLCLAAVVLLTFGCQPSGGQLAPSPTTSPASGANGSSPSAAITAPEGELGVPGRLAICTDLPYPPLEYYDDAGNEIGSDIDIGKGIAARLGLRPVIVNTVFDTIIPALLAGKCDIIISAQNITPERLEQVDMIPYFRAGMSFVTSPNGPAPKDELDLCGLSVATQSGTAEVDFIEGTGSFEGDGLNGRCVEAGKAPIDVKQFQKDSDSLLAVTSGQVDVWFADSTAAGFQVKEHPDQFRLTGIVVEFVDQGISLSKDKPALKRAVEAALAALIGDGEYERILERYGVQESTIRP